MTDFRYSEIFKSIQGEGFYTGTSSVFLRLWGCNFECRGFSNDQPDRHDTDPVTISDLNDLPVISHGCDSRYSWAAEYRHLSKLASADEICTEIGDRFGPFCHQNSGQWCHLVITGGEPMLSQTAMTSILDSFAAEHNLPRYLTIETNGTQGLRPAFRDIITQLYQSPDTELYWSVSPKLSISGETWDQAIKPDVVAAYAEISQTGQLKYVVDNSEQCWHEVETATREYRAAGVNWDVWIMPVGATADQQHKHQEDICQQALKRGYHFSARVHNWIFGNKPGT